MRTDHEVFGDLVDLCTSSGYVHCLASICHHNNYVVYQGNLSVDAVSNTYSKDKLLKTEMSLLAGCMLSKKIDYRKIERSTQRCYELRSVQLLKELHDYYKSRLQPTEGVKEFSINEYATSPDAIREMTAYSGESAYMTQYANLSVPRYSADNSWLRTNCGFLIEEAYRVVKAVQFNMNYRATYHERYARRYSHNLLSTFCFSADELVVPTGLPISTIESVLKAFTFCEDQATSSLRSALDFNTFSATPIIATPSGNYICFLIQSLFEALYQSPAFWFRNDRDYVETANANRGLYLEAAGCSMLSSVFGSDKVYRNVHVKYNKSTHISDIDCLVLFGSVAIVVQAKSKGLTLSARQGDVDAFSDDFRRSTQDSYDQAYKCARALESNESYTFLINESRIVIEEPINYIYIVCLLSEHYPSLAAQVHSSLEYVESDTIRPPFVIDIFTLDVMTRMLRSPLHFISYLHRRTMYNKSVFANHETTVLAYHLTKNLWLSRDLDLLIIDDAVSAPLDAAMYVQLDGMPGSPVPQGILTKFVNTPYAAILRQIEQSEHWGVMKLGVTLLALDEEFVNALNSQIISLTERYNADARIRFFSFIFDDGQSGLTVSCANDEIELAHKQLTYQCTLRKYKQRAKSWFGICIDPAITLRCGLSLDDDWQYDERLALLAAELSDTVVIRP